MRLQITACVDNRCGSSIHLRLLTGDFLQAFFRLLCVIHHDIEVSRQITSQTWLVEDGEVRTASLRHVRLSFFEAKYALSTDHLLQIERTCVDLAPQCSEMSRV